MLLHKIYPMSASRDIENIRKVAKKKKNKKKKILSTSYHLLKFNLSTVGYPTYNDGKFSTNVTAYHERIGSQSDHPSLGRKSEEYIRRTRNI